MARLDVERRERFERIATTSTWAAEREEACLRLQAIERRRLAYTWRCIDPNAPGQLIRFASQHDEARCVEWLKSVGVDPWGYWPDSDDPVTWAARDKLLWAALRHVVKKHTTKCKALKQVAWAQLWDARYYRKRRKAEARAAAEASE